SGALRITPVACDAAVALLVSGQRQQHQQRPHPTGAKNAEHAEITEHAENYREVIPLFRAFRYFRVFRVLHAFLVTSLQRSGGSAKERKPGPHPQHEQIRVVRPRSRPREKREDEEEVADGQRNERFAVVRLCAVSFESNDSRGAERTERQTRRYPETRGRRQVIPDEVARAVQLRSPESSTIAEEAEAQRRITFTRRERHDRIQQRPPSKVTRDQRRA